MSKCDHPVSSLCHCISLPDDQACYECVNRPWKYFTEKAIKSEVEEYQRKHPQMQKWYVNNLSEEIRLAVYGAMWLHHTAKSNERCILLAKRVIRETVNKFLERRERWVKLMIPGIEKTIAQHFLMLTNHTDAPFTSTHTEACPTCKYSDYFEPFPPRNLRELMVEIILVFIDHEGTNESAVDLAFRVSQAVMHTWLLATPEERVIMGV
jgi:hypothetical protein